MSFLLSLSSIYEAWKKFDSIKGSLYPVVIKDEQLKQAWNYLTSKEANAYKEKMLNAIRNKSTFHVDEEVVNEFLNLSGLPTEIILWDDSNGTINSPLANDIISSWAIMNFDASVVSTAITIGNIFNAIGYINRIILTKWLSAVTEK